MYFWKCWRDTRGFFLAFLMIAALVMPVAAVVCVGTGLLRDFGIEAFRSTFLIITVAVALSLGAICASQEFAEKTAHFLFTKPRPRAYFVWTSWGVGCAELLAIALVNLLAGWATLSHYGVNPFHFRSVIGGSVTAQLVGGATVQSLYVYSLTYSLTAVLRNGLRGLGASMAVVFGLPFFAIAIRWRWKINIPIPPLPIEDLSLMASSLVWILVALLFVLATQLVVERTEI
jgi:hypothetical protein